MISIKGIQYTMVALALGYGLTARAECNGSMNLPPEQVQIAFESNGAKVSEYERKHLRRWVAMTNSKYAIQNWITIVGSAESGERAPKELAMRRAVAVATEALEDGLVNAPLQIKTQVYPTGSPGQVHSDSREVIVEVSPGCPNNCCDEQ